MATNKTPKQALKDMALLKTLGYQVPIPAEALVRKEDMKDRGIKQFWKCSGKCSYTYESPVRLNSMFCPSQHKMKLIWDL